MARVRDILETKGSTVHSLTPRDMVLDALELMARHDIGAVPVIDEGELVGMFTERIYARNVFLKGRASPKTPLADVMVHEVITVKPSVSVEACMALMNEKRIRHIPVIGDSGIAGLVSIGDLMKRIIEDRKFDIEQLVEYVGH